MAEISKSDAGFLGQFEPDVFWEQHGRKIVAGLVCVLVVGLIVFYRQRQGVEEEERAAARLATAGDPMSLQGIIRDYSGKEAAAQAMLRLGDIYFQAGQFQDAANTYQQFLSSFPQHAQASAALLGLAAVQEAVGNAEAAKSQYLQLVNTHSGAYTATAAKLGAARCAMKLGQKKEARQLYEELMPMVQDTPWQMEVLLGWTILSRDAETAPASATPMAAPLAAPADGLNFALPKAGKQP